MPKGFKSVIISETKPTKDELEEAKNILKRLSPKELESRSASLRQFLKTNPDPVAPKERLRNDNLRSDQNT